MQNLTLQTADNTMSYSCKNDRDWSLNRLAGNCQSVTGHKNAELLDGDVTIGQLISPHYREEIWQFVQESLAAQIPYFMHYSIDTENNDKIIIYEQAQGVFSKEGELLEIIGFMSNITDESDQFFYENRETKLDLLVKDLVATASNNKPSKHLQNKLKEKELLTLLLICKGHSMKEIASAINLSPRTIEVYIKNLREKLCCYNKSELRKLFYATDVGPKIVTDKDFIM